LCCGFSAADGSFGSWTDGALDGNVEQRGLAACHSSLQGRREVGGALDELAVATQPFHHFVVPSLQ
jgi:hypothetical protein